MYDFLYATKLYTQLFSGPIKSIVVLKLQKVFLNYSYISGYPRFEIVATPLYD